MLPSFFPPFSFTNKSTFQISTHGGWLPYMGIGEYTSSNLLFLSPLLPTLWSESSQAAQNE